MSKVNAISQIHQLSQQILEHIYTDLDHEIGDLNNQILEVFQSYKGLISDVANYFINAKGKRIRPLLTLLCGKMLETSSLNLTKLASAVELIHTATLIHDDVIDDSNIRRGAPTINAVWGNQASILCGDFIFSQAFKLIIQTHSLQSMELLASVFSEIVEGEINQLYNLEKKDFLSKESYLQVIEYKTAKLFSAACQVAAIIKPEVDIGISKLLQEFGTFFGLIYQIKDDMADYLGPQKDKELGVDFKEGKITLPIIFLHNIAKSAEKDFIRSVFLEQKARSDQDFNKIVALLHHYQINLSVNEQVKVFAEAAKLALYQINIDNKYQGLLLELLNYITL